ncbi:hypothetical protein GGR53DRAFT_506918 [Hypoxylon sp. FL1150]|nr:hypothetical protein GGR53DRAFT_506918 [Hypoxylon sp. FL1150]
MIFYLEPYLTTDGYAHYLGEFENLLLVTLVLAVYGNSRSIFDILSSSTNGYQGIDFNNPMPLVPRYDNITAGSIYGDTDTLGTLTIRARCSTFLVTQWHVPER